MTTTDICNLALSRMGGRRIASFDDAGTTEAVSCRLHYALVRDGLLRRHQWDFAKRSVMLSRIVAVPLSEYAWAWQMPADCVRIIRLSSGDPANPLRCFERRGRQILTPDMDTLELIYVSNEVPMEEWDSLFIEAMTLKLAASICPDISQNPTLAQEINAQFETLALPTAQTADAREAASGENSGSKRMISQSQLVRARYRLGSRGWPFAYPTPDIPAAPPTP